MLTRVANGFWYFVNPALMSMFVVVWSDGDQMARRLSTCHADYGFVD